LDRERDAVLWSNPKAVCEPLAARWTTPLPATLSGLLTASEDLVAYSYPGTWLPRRQCPAGLIATLDCVAWWRSRSDSLGLSASSYRKAAPQLLKRSGTSSSRVQVQSRTVSCTRPQLHANRTVGLRVVQLVASCVVLGVGVALLLDAALGSDGYATLINGLSLALEVPFWVVNIAVGLTLVAMARMRGMRAGLGTLLQPIVVGGTVSVVMPLLPTPVLYPFRFVELGLAFLLLAFGVAGYLASELGAGPTEAAALAWDPPVPFKWSYTIVQVGGALIGFVLGAAVGPGTLLVVVLIGPAVVWVQRVLFHTNRRHPPA
jgi:uncharacterized membrane protein YczE